MILRILNASGQQLARKGFICANNGCAVEIPEIGTVPGYPLPGTRGAPGLANRIEVTTQAFNWCAAAPLNYTLNVTKQPRPSYNIGGDSLVTAPPVDTSETYRGSLHPLESGQYFQLYLDPGQTFYATGSAVGHTSYGGFFSLEVYNSAGVKVSNILNKAAYGSVSYQSSTFTNTQATAESFTVRLRTQYYPIHDFSIDFWVGGDAPVLKLFLNINDPSDPDDFVPANPEDESSKFVPGARIDGTSEALPVPNGVVQDYLQIIAAYTATNGGRVVAPPPGGDVGVLLSDTSAFKGTAMNYGDSPDPDFVLPSPGPFSFGTASYVVIPLHGKDYGGLTKVTATRGTHSAQLKLPEDAHGNWIADPGWLAGQALIPDTGLGRDKDEDNDPIGSGPPALGFFGDGLSSFEEYRGFAIRGTHRRTNPFAKDLFLSSDLTSFGISYAYPNLPTATHRVNGQDEAGLDDYRTADRVINFNFENSGAQGNIPHYDQKAVRIKEGPASGNLGFTYTDTQLPSTPNETQRIEINVAEHTAFLQLLGYTSTQIANEVRRSVGHEVGHAVHICHRQPGASCHDQSDVGPDHSIMSSDPFLGPPATDPKSQYNSYDIKQIRLHIR